MIGGSGARPPCNSSCSCQRMAAIFRKVSFESSGTSVSVAAKWPTAIISWMGVIWGTIISPSSLALAEPKLDIMSFSEAESGGRVRREEKEGCEIAFERLELITGGSRRA